jgi:hypothetical protein
MPKTEIILQVFVGSPEDVKDERITLEEVIQELNITWSDTFGIRLDLIKWETHTSPGMAEDAQAAINEQTPDTYDIFIAIFWSRLGTPTNRAKSGTIEEFNRAYERYKADRNSIEIMVYFKETPIKPSLIEHDQMKEVTDFKLRLGKLCLYFEFDSTDSFRKLVRNHLNQKIKKWAKRYYGNPVPQSETQFTVEEKLQQTDELIEEEELVEKIENSTHLIERVTFTLSHIVKEIEDLYKRLNTRIANGKKQEKVIDMTDNEKDILSAVTNTGHFLADFVYRMNFEIPLFEESLSMAMESYTNISGKRVEFINDHSNIIQHALDAVITFRSGTIKSNVKVKNFRKLIEGVLWKEPELESKCHQVFESIDKLLHRIENGKQQATKVETYLSELI